MPPERSFFGRLGMTAKFELSSLPYLLRIKEPAEGFRNLGRGAEEIPCLTEKYCLRRLSDLGESPAHS